ncbi:helix-turn-helix protein [Myceligenerans xiligouense]|uniref:Helix-turn-helix protein n=1 Tax=Myceligenerans xiligouense TaxID=253184 RepID=A0A3N4YKZ0_9MICO|nr:helix-turn-helix protein [Myceligenerans xiligouense]
MTSQYPRWSDVRRGIVDRLGEDALAEAHERTQAYIDGHRLAQRRTESGLTQQDVADRMGITKSRVSQIERGDVSTFAVIARYVEALGGTVQVTAVFGDDMYLLRGTHAA